MLLKTRRTATRKSPKRYKNFRETFKFFRQRYKFRLEKAHKIRETALASLYVLQSYNISHRNANYINTCLTFNCSGFVPKPSEVIALRAGSYCAARRSYQSLCDLEVIASLEVKKEVITSLEVKEVRGVKVLLKESGNPFFNFP